MWDWESHQAATDEMRWVNSEKHTKPVCCYKACCEAPKRINETLQLSTATHFVLNREKAS